MDGENIVGMKLIDAVKGMPDDIEMCIGAGRAFMFCGNRNEFYKDIDHVNHHQVKIVERKMKKAYNGILKKFKELKTSKVSVESLRKKSELLEELFEELLPSASLSSEAVCFLLVFFVSLDPSEVFAVSSCTVIVAVVFTMTGSVSV